MPDAWSDRGVRLKLRLRILDAQITLDHQMKRRRRLEVLVQRQRPRILQIVDYLKCPSSRGNQAAVEVDPVALSVSDGCSA